MSVASQRMGLDLLVWRYGRAALTALFVWMLLMVLAVTALAPEIIPWVPVVLLGCAFMWWLFQKPLLNLCFVLGMFPLVADFQPGIQLVEVLYAAYYVLFLTVWFFRKVFLYREPILESTVDRLVFFIIAWVVLYTGVSTLHGIIMTDAINELQSWTMLAFYYPVKEAFARYEKGPKAILTVLVIAGIFIVFRNMFTLAEKLARATVAWQITQKGRVITNETIMMVPAFGMICRSFQVRGPTAKIWHYATFLFLLVGFIMTQGRGYWLGFAFGSLILLVVLDGRSRTQFVMLGLAGLVGTAFLLWLVFGDLAILLLVGLFNRVLSIEDAASVDVSLINRFLEWKAVLKNIGMNPIMGYGMARPFPYFDISIEMTEFRTWIHNGYLSLWYQFGIVGLISVLGLYYRSIRTGLSLTRSMRKDKFAWATVTMAMASLAATLVSTIPSNAWYNSDTLLYAGICCGIIGGTKRRLQNNGKLLENW